MKISASEFLFRPDWEKKKKEAEFREKNTFIPRFDPEPPTPTVDDITPEGIVKIRFNNTME